jgi:hypothetical protein
MSVVKEIIRKQATAVKANTAKLEQAEQLEKMAAQLRAEATAPGKTFSFAEQRQRKLDKTESVGKAMFEAKIKPAKQQLTNAGFVRIMTDKEGAEIFGNNTLPGHLITLRGITYEGKFHQELRIANAPVENIGDYIKSLK